MHTINLLNRQRREERRVDDSKRLLQDVLPLSFRNPWDSQGVPSGVLFQFFGLIFKGFYLLRQIRDLFVFCNNYRS
jgi:hypothetical protein